MNSKLAVLFMAGLAVFAGNPVGVRGQTAAIAPAAPALTWTLTPAVVSHYMFRGMRFGGPSFQPTLETGYGNLTAGLWANLPISDKVPGVSDPELDFYGSYNVALNAATTVAIGWTWYHFPRADERAGFYENTFEPSLALNYTIAGLRLTPKVYYDFMLDGATLELAAFYALPLQQFGTELDFTGVIGAYEWDDSTNDARPAIRNVGEYWSLGVALPFQVSANSKVTIGWAYAKGSENYFKQGSAPQVENALAAGRGVTSVAYSIAF